MIKKTGIQEIRHAENYPSEPIIVQGIHDGWFREKVITIQMPQGCLSEIRWDNQTKFKAYMIDFVLDDMGSGDSDGDNGIKARLALREYLIQYAEEWGKLASEEDQFTVGDMQVSGHHFYAGYMAALRGKTELTP